MKFISILLFKIHLNTQGESTKPLDQRLLPFYDNREHLDYFGVAATAYLLLFTTYMDIVKVGLIVNIGVETQPALFRLKKPIENRSDL